MIRALIEGMRPRQWIKNAVVPAALIFAIGDPNQQIDAGSFLRVTLAFIAFCLASSAVYLLNDIKDVELDRLHPTKRQRPIASGRLTVPVALAGSVFLALAASVGGWFLQPLFGYIVLGYLVLQVAYTHVLKRVPVADVLCIATGFVLRADGGAVAIGVQISYWLLLCTGLLALFLGFCKRRHEKVVLNDLKDKARPVLAHYSERGLDQLISIMAGATVTAYFLYTISADTVAKFGHSRLVFTVPFVAAGLYRYYVIVYQHDKGGRPEQVLLTDIKLLGIIAGYGLAVLYVFL